MGNNTINEDIVLLNFLKSGLSTRKLDFLLGFSGTKGWKAWEILKKYNLKNEDKGKLFLYTETQSKKFIKIIKTKGKSIDELIGEIHPSNLEKYRDIFIFAKSEKSLYSACSGETRNIIRDFFNPKKRLIGKCQFKDCKNTNIDTVHLSRDRPEIFMDCAMKNKQKEGVFFRYDLYKIMKCFLSEHAKAKIICFLCKQHHNHMHKLQKKDNSELKLFKNDIRSENG